MVEATALVEATGQAATREAVAVEAAVYVGVAVMVEASGQGATMEEAMGRELVWWKGWRRLEAAGRKCCWQCCCSYTSCWQCTLEVPLVLY